MVEVRKIRNVTHRGLNQRGGADGIWQLVRFRLITDGDQAIKRFEDELGYERENRNRTKQAANIFRSNALQELGRGLGKFTEEICEILHRTSDPKYQVTKTTIKKQRSAGNPLDPCWITNRPMRTENFYRCHELWFFRRLQGRSGRLRGGCRCDHREFWRTTRQNRQNKENEISAELVT